MEFKCPTITVTKQDEKKWLVYDDVTPIVGKGISRESAFKCYDRGIDLLQQKHAGIDTGMNDYLDYLEQNYSGDKKMNFATHSKNTICNITTPSVKSPTSNGHRICDTCNKKDVCMYKDECAKAMSDIQDILDTMPHLIVADVKCKKWSDKVVNYR